MEACHQPHQIFNCTPRGSTRERLSKTAAQQARVLGFLNYPHFCGSYHGMPMAVMLNKRDAIGGMGIAATTKFGPADIYPKQDGGSYESRV
jgi:hypothetical protein